MEKKRAYNKAYYQANKDKFLAAKRKWIEKDPDKYREYCRRKTDEWRKKNPENIERWREMARASYHRRKAEGRLTRNPISIKREHLARYGLTIEKYDELVSATGGKCPICSRAFGDKKPHIDHCHKTGDFRAIICGKCNTAEGMLETSENAFKLYQYMLRNEGKLNGSELV